MRIVGDRAIPGLASALSAYGRVCTYPAEELNGPTLADADVLVVRTVTRIDSTLLEAAPSLRFVASATAGIDHVDTAALARRNIAFAYAAGCNAQSVVDYTLTAIVWASERLGQDWRGPIGVVGCGHIGRRVVSMLRQCGIEVWVCDPPLAERVRSGAPVSGPLPEVVAELRFSDLDELVDRCSVLTFHVSCERSGPHRTVGMLTAERLAQIGQNILLINTSRGDIIERDGLSRWIDNGGRAVLDVWPSEPALDASWTESPLVIGTPHIAGYSRTGKLSATRAVQTALEAWLEVKPKRVESSPPTRSPWPTHSRKPTTSALADLLLAACPIDRDDEELRAIARLPNLRRGPAFESYRKRYPLRFEFSELALSESQKALALQLPSHAARLLELLSSRRSV